MYGYDGGPNWGRIHAEKRERQARSEAAHAKASAGVWQARAEELAAYIYEYADKTHPVHREQHCHCRQCWTALVKEIFEKQHPPPRPFNPTDRLWGL
ncbi:hypothetical protein [Streptomyces niveus]|uniref:hypothetical protein n=1 Tax=Streptomyces niveus TaxID=193462 RepID=UPI003649FAC2